MTSSGPAGTAAGRAASAGPAPGLALPLAVLAWFALWYATPGLHDVGVGSLLGLGDSALVLVESAVVLVLTGVLVLVERRRTAAAFARSRWMLAYLVPAVLAAALPLHYELPLPVATYLVWMAASVLWQQYITVGLLQAHVREHLGPGWAIAVVALVFYAGHALFLPGAFAPTQVLPALAILALGGVLAGLRQWTGTIHLTLALHLAFYYIFA